VSNAPTVILHPLLAAIAAVLIAALIVEVQRSMNIDTKANDV